MSDQIFIRISNQPQNYSVYGCVALHRVRFVVDCLVVENKNGERVRDQQHPSSKSYQSSGIVCGLSPLSIYWMNERLCDVKAKTPDASWSASCSVYFVLLPRPLRLFCVHAWLEVPFCGFDATHTIKQLNVLTFGSGFNRPHYIRNEITSIWLP